MTKRESGRALLRAFGDAARMIAGGYDPRLIKSVVALGEPSRRSAAYQKGLLAAFATAYGS